MTRSEAADGGMRRGSSSVAAITIAPMQRDDWRRVKAILAAGLASGIAAFMATPPTYAQFNASRLPLGRIVARRDGEVVGWASLARVADT